MKKLLILIVLFSLSVQSYALTESETTLYKKWSLKNYSYGTLYFDYGQKDCLWFTNDFSGSWDLLGSLIVDNQFRKEMSGKQDLDNDGNYEPNPSPLKVYSPEYILDLDKTISKRLKVNFYARYVCHIDTNTDIVAGAYISDASRSNILILRKNDNIFILPKRVQLYGNSYTGGDAAHCEANLGDKNTFTWSCWLGFLRDTTGVIGDQSREYTLSLMNGKILKIRNRVIKL